MNELVLTESRAARDDNAGRIDVLDKVKIVDLMPGDMHVTTEMVAGYYEVHVDAVESVIRRNRDELESNGLRTLRGDDLRDFKRSTDRQADGLWDRINALTVFTRPTVLNVGMLLADSDIARQVRRALLDRYDDTAARPDYAAIEGRIRILGTSADTGLISRAEARHHTRQLLADAGIELGEAPDPPTRTPRTRGGDPLDRVADLILHHLHQAGGRSTRSVLRQHLHRDRRHLFDAAVAHLETAGLLHVEPIAGQGQPGTAYRAVRHGDTGARTGSAA